jgi:hypothetical protein
MAEGSEHSEDQDADQDPGSARRTWRVRGQFRDYLFVQSFDLTGEESHERVPLAILVHELDRWLSSLFTRRLCIEMYEVLTGSGPSDLLLHGQSVDLLKVKRRLVEALRDGELVAVG